MPCSPSVRPSAQAVACLSKLKKSDLDEVKSLKNPPSGVRLTMEAACIMFRVRPVLKNDPDKPVQRVQSVCPSLSPPFISTCKPLSSISSTFLDAVLTISSTSYLH